MYSIENLPYVDRFLVLKFNPNVIPVVQIQGIYKVCNLPYILKLEFYWLQGYISLDVLSSFLVMDEQLGKTEAVFE